MDFWNDHTIWFVIGIIVWPRVLLLYFGLIPPIQIPPILGFLFIPRIYLVSLISPIYWDHNSTLIVICWVLAILIDVASVIIKLTFQKSVYEQTKENLEANMRLMRFNSNRINW